MGWYQQANNEGKALCFIAKINYEYEVDLPPYFVASATLKAIDQDHQFFGLEGTENIIKYNTERYSSYPLVHRGPGAGPEVTAAGIFSDLLALLNTH